MSEFLFAVHIANVADRFRQHSAMRLEFLLFIEANQDRGHCKALPPQSAERDGTLNRHLRENGNHGRIARHSCCHLQRETRELEPVREFEPRKSLADLLKLIET